MWIHVPVVFGCCLVPLTGSPVQQQPPRIEWPHHQTSTELRRCVKVEVAVPDGSCGLCGRKATLEDPIFGNQALLKEPSKLWSLCLQSASWSWWITTKAASRTLPRTTIQSLWPASLLTALSSSPLRTDSCWCGTWLCDQAILDADFESGCRNEAFWCWYCGEAAWLFCSVNSMDIFTLCKSLSSSSSSLCNGLPCACVWAEWLVPFRTWSVIPLWNS